MQAKYELNMNCDLKEYSFKIDIEFKQTIFAQVMKNCSRDLKYSFIGI